MIGDTCCSEWEANERWSDEIDDWEDMPKLLRMKAAELISRLYNDPESFIGHGKDDMSNEVQEFECNCEVIMDALGCPQNEKNRGHRWG
tara:strand:+ start:70 stop:336 length:267 start_codon:yes stop_codon:yes gene_type:complete